MEMKKLIAVSIIFLFIGVAVAPTINFTVVKASNNNDLVEVTTQACGIKGYGDATVKLTRQQYNELQQYLIEFRARLNQTSTREEAVPIFKETVVELNKYGLLPKGMSISQELNLITGGSSYLINQHKSKFVNTFRRVIDSNSRFQNFFCLLYIQANRLSGIEEMGPLYTVAGMLVFMAPDIFFSGHFFLAFLCFYSGMIFLIMSYPSFIYNHISPIKLWVNLFLTYPEIWSVGLKGHQHSLYMNSVVFGFKGLRISSQNTSAVYYIGQALMY
jgi:hypothetical protein